MRLKFRAIGERRPGREWQQLFRRFWPAYRRWWLAGGDSARPSYLECRRALEAHMPELLPVYERVVELAGGGDHEARFLSMYSPPPYLAGCSQAVWSGTEPLLVRNYDYSPHAFDALLLHTQWLGRKVLGVSDCMMGLLDGMNEDGLAVSLTFGGRRVTGRGFGIPIVLRYVLETCTDTDQAVAVLKRIPCHMAYNVTVLDAAKRYRTVFISPDCPAAVTSSPAATNHQHKTDSPEYASGLTSVEREEYLLGRLTRHPETIERFIAAFQRPPLYSLRFEHGFGTLYTAVYQPRALTLDLHWPGLCWSHSINRFEEGSCTIDYRY